jgi:hypothetical protein
MSRKLVAAGVAAGAAVLAGSLYQGTQALADTASTPIGTITAQQYNGYCDDFGAHVRVTVTGGSPATKYTVWGTGFGTAAQTLTTNAQGAGTIDVHNVRTGSTVGRVGNGVVLVSAGYYTVTVPAAINCPDNQGG